jgi:hypothetical protein
MTNSLRRRVSVLVAVFFILAGAGRSQAPGTGAITGTVYDPSGAAIPNAPVLVVNQSTNVPRSATTSLAGVFTISLLTPGSYSATVDAPGFEVKTAQSVPVVVSETSTVDFHLAMANAGVTVQVRAGAEIAQSESSTLGRAVDQETIEALPLANRNYTQILSLSPGVVVGLPDAATLGRGTQDVTANGSKTTANNIQFNGIDANNLAQNSAASDLEEVGVAVPAPDTILEFKVQTGNFDATYGRGTGANVDVVSRTGSNRLHGSAWEFLRNDIVTANDFFSKLNGQPRPVLKQNQYGIAIGGPIRRDRIFYFGAYQGLRSINGVGDKVTATLPQLTSDRSSATLGRQFCGFSTNAGGTQVACDGSNISPVALALLNFKFPNGSFAIPTPQTNLPVTDPNQMPIGESTFATPAKYNEDQYTANVDQVVTQKNQLSEKFFFSRAPTVSPFSPFAANVPGWGTNELDQNAMLVVADTHVFNSRLANIARFGYMRFDGISAVSNPILASDLGTQSPTGASGANVTAPAITVDGLFTIGDAGTPSQAQVTNTFVWQDTVSLSLRNQSIRLGAEAKRHQVEIDAPFAADGLLDISSFNDFLLGQSAAQNGSPNGISNVTTSVGTSGLFRKDERYTDFATFLQDDVKVTPRLMVNAGLRYEIFGAPSEISGRLATFDPRIASPSIPSTGSLSGFVVPSNFTGPSPAGVIKSSIPGLWPTKHDDISPRLGFVLRVSEHPTVLLRGGYGIYFDRLSAQSAENLLLQEPFSTEQNFSKASNGGASLQAPFSPLLPNTSSFPFFTPRIPGGGPSITAISTHMTDPYTQEYNLNTQMEFARDYLFELGYVGTRSLHVVGCREFNQAQLASPTDPVNGATTNTVLNVVQRVPFAGVSPGSLLCESSFNSNFNSLQSSLAKRFSHGLQFLASYTWSRNLDQTSGSSGGQVFEQWLLTNDQNNPKQAYGPTDFDRSHRAILSFTYNTPDMRSREAMMRHAFNGWQISGVLVAQSGTPITVLDYNAGAVYGNFVIENRAQRTGLDPSTSGSLHSRVLGQYLNSAAFTSTPMAPNGIDPSDTDFGNSGVGIVRGPGQHNIDIAIERTIPIAEAHGIHIRAECFNLTNAANFGNPNNAVTSGAAFGVITTTVTNPRIVQLALKYKF